MKALEMLAHLPDLEQRAQTAVDEEVMILRQGRVGFTDMMEAILDDDLGEGEIMDREELLLWTAAMLAKAMDELRLVKPPEMPPV